LVEQAVARGRIKLQKTGRIYRTVDLLPPLREDLSTWFAAGGHDDSDARLFARDDGEWFKTDDWNNWRNRHFYAALDALAHQPPASLRPPPLLRLAHDPRGPAHDRRVGGAARSRRHGTLRSYAHVFAEYRRQPRVPAKQLIAEARRSAP
jgi:hypothetical protein